MRNRLTLVVGLLAAAACNKPENSVIVPVKAPSAIRTISEADKKQLMRDISRKLREKELKRIPDVEEILRRSEWLAVALHDWAWRIEESSERSDGRLMPPKNPDENTASAASDCSRYLAGIVAIGRIEALSSEMRLRYKNEILDALEGTDLHRVTGVRGEFKMLSAVRSKLKQHYKEIVTPPQSPPSEVSEVDTQGK